VEAPNKTKEGEGPMKANFVRGMLVVGGLALASTGFAIPEIVQGTFSEAYVPEGFDSNDNTQVVTEGIYPNGCYRPATPVVKVDEAAKTVTVDAQAFYYDTMCPQVLVPYHQTLNLGVLGAGRYQILNKSDMNNLGQLSVRVATNSTPDDFPYAPVDQAYFEKVDQYHQLKLQGTFRNSCMTLVDVQIDRQPKVIVVQPIAEMDQSRTDCKEGEFPFTETKVIENLAKGRYLLHVRALNAEAINHLVDAR
jgi:hypothetical protein